MTKILPVYVILSLFWIGPALADRDLRGKNHCRNVAGTYISRNIDATSPDTQEVFLSNRIVMIHDDGTIATYQSAQLDQLDQGNELTPAMGNWRCAGRNTIQAVAFDYFSRGVGLGGNLIGNQEWNEFDRFTMRIDFWGRTAIMKLRLIGIDKNNDSDKLNPDVAATVVSEIQTYELERIGPVRALVEADFAREIP